MNADLKAAFAQVKPACDLVMVCPSAETLAVYTEKVMSLEKHVLQELQQYVLYPFITHIKFKEIKKLYDLQCKLVDTMSLVLERVTVNSYEMCVKIERGLLGLVLDLEKTGMVADAPEELKFSVMKGLTTLLLNLDNSFRVQYYKEQMPMIAQAVFVSVHIAKLEKYGALRLAAIECLNAQTHTHKSLMNENMDITDPDIRKHVIEMLCSILPGVTAALQDVATSHDNPNHAVIVAAIDSIHRVTCLAMSDKHLEKKESLTSEDFAKLVLDKSRAKDVSCKEKKAKDLVKRSPEWFALAGEKMVQITKSVASLLSYDHFKVRRELAVFCSRILNECNTTMQPSIPLILDMLISLAKDDNPQVAQFATDAVNSFLANSNPDERSKTMDVLCENFVTTLKSLPRIMNNIDSGRKLTTLNLLHGYLVALSAERGVARLAARVSVARDMRVCCHALREAAAVDAAVALFTSHVDTDILKPPPLDAPWRKFRHLDTPTLEQRLRDICRLLGNAECAELVLDSLIDLVPDEGAIAVINWMASAPDSSPRLAQRVINTYIEDCLWSLPLEVASGEVIGDNETMDVSVYNPRAWVKDRVPDLYEGAIETRYTDISLLTPRSHQSQSHNPQSHGSQACHSLAQAHTNMLITCLITEGMGLMALRLKEEFQPYLLKTLCKVLERVGSKYELLHLAGLKAINAIATSCGHSSVAELVSCNADYFTNQVTVRLKKAWNSQSALQILSVVMQYSDSSILDCLYGIVEDVLVQSCDKYYEKDLYSYLQVFLTFIECIRKWFPYKDTNKVKSIDNLELDIGRDFLEYIENVEESERLLSKEEFEKESGKNVEEMYKEDVNRREENELDYDDTVQPESPPLPQHIKVTITILKRSLNFIPSRKRDESILAIQILNLGLPILGEYDNELLPLVHLSWSPLLSKFEAEPVVARRACDLLVTMAALAKDFILGRAVREVLPHIYKYLHKSATDSYLKDAGSSYRNSQAYTLQVSALTAVTSLMVDLGLREEKLDDAIECVVAYLSNKQPKPLQTLAVNFFKRLVDYDCGAAWHHLRKLCANDVVLPPPDVAFKLEPVVGTPYEAADKDYDANIKLIFDHV